MERHPKKCDGILEDIAQIPKDSQTRVLPDHDCGGGEEKKCHTDPVVPPPVSKVFG